MYGHVKIELYNDIDDNLILYVITSLVSMWIMICL